MTPIPTNAPSCSLDRPALAARVAAWRELSAAVVAATRTDTGAELRYRPDPGVVERLAALVEAESSCCPDLRFDLTVTLRMAAPEGMRDWVGETFVPG